MGHGDTICFADANFPSESLHTTTAVGSSTTRNCPVVIRADGLTIAPLLSAVATLLPLDTYTEYSVVKMMAAVPGDSLDPAVEERFRAAIETSQPGTFKIERVERFKFYDLAREAFAVVATGETASYGNVILTKGVLRVGVNDAGLDVFRMA